MSEYSATISWQRGEYEPFVDQRYSRAHEWAFDGGVRVPASSSPHVVPLPYSVAEHVDPEGRLWRPSPVATCSPSSGWRRRRAIG